MSVSTRVLPILKQRFKPGRGVWPGIWVASTEESGAIVVGETVGLTTCRFGGYIPDIDKTRNLPASLQRESDQECLQVPHPTPNQSFRIAPDGPLASQTPSQKDLEVPRPTSSTSFRLSKTAPTCCCQHAALTNCTSNTAYPRGVSRVREAGSLRGGSGTVLRVLALGRLSAQPLRARPPGIFR